MEYKGKEIIYSIYRDNDKIYNAVDNKEYYYIYGPSETIIQPNMTNNIPPTLNSKYIGNSLHFDTDCTYIKLPSLNLTTDDIFTIKFWTRLGDNRIGWATFSLDFDNGNGISFWYNLSHIGIYRNGNGYGDNNHIYYFKQAIQYDTWIHVEINFIGNHTIMLYLNGEYAFTIDIPRFDIHKILLGNWGYPPRYVYNTFYGSIFDFALLKGNLHTEQKNYTLDNKVLFNLLDDYTVYENKYPYSV